MLGFFDRFRHRGMRELLSSYIDDEVSDSERRRVESHLSECDECRRELESLRMTVLALRRLPEIQTTRSFAISENPGPAGEGMRWVLGIRLAASATAVVLVGLIVADVTGLFVQSDLSEWARQTERAQSEAQAQPAAAAPAAAPASAPDMAPGAPAQPAAPAPAAPAAAPVQAVQVQAASAPAPTVAPAAPAPTTAPVAMAMKAEPQPTPVPSPDVMMAKESRMQDSPTQEGATADSPAVATSSAESLTEEADPAPPTTIPSATTPPTSTATPEPTSTLTPTPTPVPTATPTSTPTPVFTSTPTTEPSSTPTVAPTVSPPRLFEAEDKPTPRPSLPLLQLEIALGVLLIVLLGLAYWMSRRSR